MWELWHICSIDKYFYNMRWILCTFAEKDWHFTANCRKALEISFIAGANVGIQEHRLNTFSVTSLGIRNDYKQHSCGGDHRWGSVFEWSIWFLKAHLTGEPWRWPPPSPSCCSWSSSSSWWLAPSGGRSASWPRHGGCGAKDGTEPDHTTSRNLCLRSS